jgi:hypothetical protein
MKPFSQGLPGSIYNVLTPLFESQSFIAFAINSGPLSLRINPGDPRKKRGQESFSYN